MNSPTPEIVPIRSESDVVIVRQNVRKWSISVGFSLVDQTKIVTAASELARNTLIHGGGGELKSFLLQEGNRKGLCLIFDDQGPGIPDIEKALQDGYTTKGGMGLGLGGSKRLSNEFELKTEVGKGTSIKIIRWKA